jgi:poly-gamma-glutamate capsule biosynthesis protein CapA/YwtB (metallophosphatase superfamily)
MLKEEFTLRVRKPHQGDIGRELLSRILKQARSDRDPGKIVKNAILSVMARNAGRLS